MKKYKYHELVYHITTKENAINILENNFDISKSKNFAFGYGISFTTDKNHLEIYHNINKKKNNYVVVSMIQYNKLHYNTSTDKMINGYSKPKFWKIPNGYDGFYSMKHIRIIQNTKLIFPITFYKYK